MACPPYIEIYTSWSHFIYLKLWRWSQTWNFTNVFGRSKHKSFLEENTIILSFKESWKFLTSMNRTQLKTTKHTRENGNMSKNQQKYHTAEANKQWLQMVVLSDTDYKILVLFKENIEEIIVNWIRRIISCDLSLWCMLDNVF